MAPVMEAGELAQVEMGIQEEATPSCLTTTLYDLIAVMQDGLNPDHDTLVVAIVVHFLRSGRLTWRGQARERLDQARHAAMGAIPRVAPRTTAEKSWAMGQQ
jgi:hypothetical protein